MVVLQVLIRMSHNFRQQPMFMQILEEAVMGELLGQAMAPVALLAYL